jgi:apolipoprotein N-acyltransferase
MLLVAVLAYGNLRLAAEVPVRKRLDTVMVQQNADSWVRGNEVATIRTSQRLTRAGLRELAEPPDLVMWSETALRYRYVEDRRFYESNPAEEPFVDFVRESGVPLLTGAPYTEPSTGDWFNATLLIAPDTRVVEYYGKRQLVPFAENVPLWDVPFVRRFFNEVIGLPATWSPGPEETIFDLELGDGSSLRFATPICFEDAFAAINRRFVRGGAEALINLTNNSWSRTDSAQTQHFVASRFRAIENRRTLIRSTNSGLSGVVDPHRRLIEQAPMFEETFLTASIPIRYPSGLTVYTRAGDWFPLFMLGFVYLWMGAYVVDRHRKGSAVGPL